ncbi:MAG: hypothetical protein ABIS36_17115 [Chryseolinea sp.]
MKINFKKQRLVYPLLALLVITLDTSAQVKSVYSMNAAYSALNSSSSGGPSYVGNSSTGIKAVVTATSIGYVGPLNKKWDISFGIPTQVVLDYAYLRGAMINAYEDNPDLYNSGTPEFKQAVDFLGWTDFSPISAWAPVKCTVKFRFIPPVLGDNYDLKYDFRNNPSAAPERGTATFWIR